MYGNCIILYYYVIVHAKEEHLNKVVSLSCIKGSTFSECQVFEVLTSEHHYNRDHPLCFNLVKAINRNQIG